MIIGDPSKMAIESGITKAYARLSSRALGFFLIHVGGHQYGVRAPDATMMALSYDQVRSRLADRSRHFAPFASDPDAGKIADAFSEAFYIESQRTDYLGLTRDKFAEILASNHLKWAPDGDEAFDDSSYILQFDIEDYIRLIAFKRLSDFHEPTTLRDIWMKADDFYLILTQWADKFLAEWESLPKISG